ncbi:MAG: hypothetical protein Tsb0010_10090 [Parvularculaceae bacterium]
MPAGKSKRPAAKAAPAKRIGASAKKTRKASRKNNPSPAFESLRRGLGQALVHAKGEKTSARVHKIRVDAPDVAAIRAKTGLSQSAFATSIGVSLGTLQGWEQGRRRAQGPARILLALIDKRPTIVQDELAA